MSNLQAAPAPTQPRVAGILELDRIDIVVGQPEITIARNFSISLLPGQFHGIRGRSGSGKTSILRVAAGLREPTAGAVFWQGEPISSLDRDERARRRRELIGYVDQQANLIDGFTVLENVLMPAVPGRTTKDRKPHAMELLASLGVGGKSADHVDTLSGGERQRVALARALLMNPPILIADEPTASLDRNTADTVIELLAGYAASGKALLVAAHDASIFKKADHIYDID
ncbi:MAG: ATP-binding cassette domain-containing protein [Cryobacterium sp.]|nr:ATP-binding cassette domain-containing protein [Cryobacterium sp.]MBX3089408.1 ATP-binding cassette domain-containing protein [Cryobacterium sp.]